MKSLHEKPDKTNKIFLFVLTYFHKRTSAVVNQVVPGHRISQQSTQVSHTDMIRNLIRKWQNCVQNYII